MKVYNKALDYVCLALNELATNKRPVLAARLLADAAAQPDVMAAIRTLEISNAHAHKLQQVKASSTSPKRRIRASQETEFPFGEEGEEGEEKPMEVESEFGGDPLDEVEDNQMIGEEEADEAPAEEPAVAMARVLSSMKRKSSYKK